MVPSEMPMPFSAPTTRRVIRQFAADKALALAEGGDATWERHLVEELAARTGGTIEAIRADLSREAAPLDTLEELVLGLRALGDA